jgi:hypothetical protein
MDVRGSVDETIEQARKELDAGNYRGAVALLEPLLRPRAKEKLSPQQECDVVGLLSSCYRFLDDDKAALPHAQQRLALEQHLHCQGFEGAVHGAAEAQIVGARHHGRAGPATGWSTVRCWRSWT